MFKTLGYVMFATSAVTLYVHIRNHDLKPIHFGRSAVEDTSADSTRGEIVVAPLHGNNLNDRWQGETGGHAGGRR